MNQMLRARSPDILQAEGGIVRLGDAEIDLLRQSLEHSSRGRSRICAHPDSAEPLHEMIIALSSSTYIRPHKHRDKSESFHMIQGEVDVVFFDDFGAIMDVVELGSPGSGKCFYYRMSKPFFHTVLVRSGQAVFHETTNGPFVAEETMMADWAPADDDKEAVQAFQSALLTSVTCFLK